MPVKYEQTLEILNYIFLVIFNLEAALKIIALNTYYFTVSRWNRFDFFIVIISDITLILNLTLNIEANVTIIRAL